MSSPVVSRVRRSRTVGNTPIGSANPTLTSLDAIRDDPRTPQREWSVLEAILLEGQEHPLRRTNSTASLIQQATPDNERPWSRAATFPGLDRHENPPRSNGNDYFVQPTSPSSEPAMMQEALSASVHIATELEGSDSSDTDSPAQLEKSQFSYLPSLTTLQRDILKCSIAYFVGSLFTFNPYLSSLISDISAFVP